MLKVHVWPPHGNMVGHASLSFENNYISFWPEDSAGKKDLKIKRSQPGHFMQGLRDDIAAEGGRKPITITITVYNSEDLSKFIADLIDNTPRYQLAKCNCSNVVAECLKIACRKEASFVPTAYDYGRTGRILGRGIWTPNEILRYARELAAHSGR